MEFNIKKVEKNKNINKKMVGLYLRKILMESLVIARLFYPYVIGAGAVIGAFSLVDATPFVRDMKTQVLHQDGTIDSLGNGKIASYYDYSTKTKPSTIKYISKWHKKNDGYYERNNKVYSLENIDLNAIKKYIMNPKTINNLESIFGKSTSQETEIKANLTEEELNAPEIIEATIYSVDKNDIIKVKESGAENVMSTIITIVLTIVACYGIFIIRGNMYGYDFVDADRDICRHEEEYRNKVNELKQIK